MKLRAFSMDYQSIFNLYFYLILVGFLGLTLATVIYWKSKSVYDKYEKIRNSKYKKQIIMCYRVGFTAFTIMVFFTVLLPIARDKKSINNKTYNIDYSRLEYVENAGLYSPTRKAGVVVDGTIIEVDVLKGYKPMEKGDYVKVTWLENSKEAVVEKCDKEE